MGLPGQGRDWKSHQTYPLQQWSQNKKKSTVKIVEYLENNNNENARDRDLRNRVTITLKEQFIAVYTSLYKMN